MKRFSFPMGLAVLFYLSASCAQTMERLSLQDAVTIAITNNPRSLASSQYIEAERGRFWRGVSPPPPSVAVNYEYIPRGAAVRHFGERTVEISQSIDFPSTMYLRGVQLSEKVSIAEAEHASMALAITLDVKLAYYTVLARQKKIELARENLSIAGDFAGKAEIRYNVGEATNLERLTAAVQRTQARNAVETAQNDYTISVGELYHVLGRRREEQKPDIVLTDSLAYRPFAWTLEHSIDKALTINPRLTAASGRVSEARVGSALAWSGFLPGLNASYYRQTVAGGADFYGISFGVSVPLWFFFDQRGQIQEAAATAGIAEHELQSLTNSTSVNVRNAYLEMENNERQIRLHQTDILPQAEEVYRTAHASYEAGEITYIEFLQARQISMTSRADYIEELARFWSSVAKLEYAVGLQSFRN